MTRLDYMAQRDRIVREFPFSEGARNILLDLAQARVDGRSISVTSACLASGVAPTTALRHVQLLVNAGLVVRVPHAGDARSILLHLTDETFARVEALFCPAAAVARAA